MDVFIGTIQDILFKEDLAIVYFYKITGIFSNIKGCLSRESYPLRQEMVLSKNIRQCRELVSALMIMDLSYIKVIPKNVSSMELAFQKAWCLVQVGKHKQTNKQSDVHGCWRTRWGYPCMETLPQVQEKKVNKTKFEK